MQPKSNCKEALSLQLKVYLDFTEQNRFLFHVYVVIAVHVTGKVKGNIEFTEELEAEANKWIEENLSFTDLRFPSK